MKNKLIKKSNYFVEIDEFELDDDIVIKIMEKDNSNNQITLAGSAAKEFLAVYKKYLQQLQNRESE